MAHLYRHFNIKDEVIYIGYTSYWDECKSRFQAQKHSAKWWNEVAFSKLEYFDNWWDAAKAEELAIINELPIYNIACQPFNLAIRRLLKYSGMPKRKEHVWKIAHDIKNGIPSIFTASEVWQAASQRIK